MKNIYDFSACYNHVSLSDRNVNRIEMDEPHSLQQMAWNKSISVYFNSELIKRTLK